MHLKIPYLQWRAGRPRWEPGPKLRALGFKGCDLKTADGQWMGMGEAMARAGELNEAARAPKARRTAAQKPAAGGILLAHVFAAFTATPEFRRLARKTQSDYLNKAQVFLDFAGDAPVASLRRKMLKSFWRSLHETRGHAMANGVMAVLRLTLAHGLDEEWIGVNPASKLRLPTVPPRVVIWSPAQCAAMLDAADALGEHAIGDAIVLALHTAQRQGDILAFDDNLIDAGQVNLHQKKTGAIVSFPATAILIARLTAAKARNAGNVARLNAWPLIVDPSTGRRFNTDTFRHRFALVRAEAGKTEPGCLDKTFQDFRDTALTRLYLSGLTILRIASISGHDIKTVDQVLRHYIALNADDGRAAIASYETWLDKQGVRV